MTTLPADIRDTLTRVDLRLDSLPPRMQQQLAMLLDPVRDYLDVIEHVHGAHVETQSAYICRECERADAEQCSYETVTDLIRHRVAEHGIGPVSFAERGEERAA